MSLICILLLFVNFGISWFNAKSVGQSWADSKAIGGWPRLLVWCAAIMSASGFTWVYLTLLAVGAGAAGLLTPRYVNAALELGYVIIIGPVIGSGLAIWMDSVTTAWRERSFSSTAVAGWNTFAQIHNTYEAASMLPNVLKDLGDAFSGDSDDDSAGPAIFLVILIAAFALAGGVLTTCAIVKSTAREYAKTAGTSILPAGARR